MKKTKIAVLVSVILIVVGLGCAVLGICLGAEKEIYVNGDGVHVGGGNITDWRNVEDAEEKTLHLGEFHSVDVSLSAADVELIPSNGWRVEYRISRSMPLSRCEVENGTLIVRSQQGFSVFNLFTLLNQGCYVKIYYPEGTEFETVKLGNASGKVVADDVLAKTLELSSTSGKVSAEGATVETLSVSAVSGYISAANTTVKGKAVFDTTSGEVCVDHLSAGSTEVYTVSGSLSAVSAKAGERLTFSSTSGDVQTDGLECGFLSIDTVSGYCSGEGVTADGVSFGSTSGDCLLSGDLRGNMEFSSISGRIKLKTSSARADYRLDLDSVSGQRRVNEKSLEEIGMGDGDMLISVSTTSGDISISFAK